MNSSDKMELATTYAAIVASIMGFIVTLLWTGSLLLSFAGACFSAAVMGGFVVSL